MMNWQENIRSILVHPDEIELSDRTYYLPCYDEIGPLVESISQVGVLSPPVVRKNDDGTLVPVIGRRRLKAAIEARITGVSVLVVNASEPEKNCVSLLFWDNISRIRQNLVTVAVMSACLLNVFDLETVSENYLPWLGVPPRGPRLVRLRSIAKLDERSLRALWSGRIVEKTAVLLAALNIKDRLEMLNFIDRYGWNANKSDEILQAVHDLSILAGKSTTKTICQAIDWVETQHKEEDPVRKSEKMRNLIRSWKFGDLFQHQDLFGQWLQKLDLPRNIRVKPAQSFENQSVSIEVTANSLDHAKKIIQTLVDSINIK